MQMRNLLTFLTASVAAAQRTGMPPPAMNGTITTTIVVDSFVTYCPVPTVITYKDVCYTAKTPGPVTITNCPCTITTTVPKVTVGPPPVQTQGAMPPPPPKGASPPAGPAGPVAPPAGPPAGPVAPPAGPAGPVAPPAGPAGPAAPPAGSAGPVAPPAAPPAGPVAPVPAAPAPPANPPVAPVAPVPAAPGGGQVTGAYQPVQPKPTYVTAGAAGLKASALVLAGALAGVVAL